MLYNICYITYSTYHTTHTNTVYHTQLYVWCMCIYIYRERDRHYVYVCKMLLCVPNCTACEGILRPVLIISIRKTPN